MDLISIVLPVFNSEKFIFKSIKSILNQTYKHIELIIINDASTDNSEKIILKFKDKRIKYIKNKFNLGEQKTTNVGLKLCKGKYISIMHSDDIAHKNKIEEQTNYLNKNKNIFLVGTSYNIIDENEKIIKIVNKKKTPKKINKKILKGKNIICHPTIMFRKEKINYRSKIYYCPDLDLYLRLIKKNKKIAILNKVLLNYRVHFNQISISKKYKQNLFKKITLEINNGERKYKLFNPQKILNINEKKLDYKEQIIYHYLYKNPKKIRDNYIKYIYKEKKIDKYLFYYLYSYLINIYILFRNNKRIYF